MSTTVIVLGEFFEGYLRQTTFEAIHAAKEMYEDVNIVTVLLGEKDLAEAAETCIHHGSDRIVMIEDDAFKHYTADSYSQALLSVIREEEPDGIITGDTSIGRDTAIRVARKLSSGLVLDVTEIERTADDISYIRPIYSGDAYERIIIKGTLQIITIRPNHFSVLEADTERAGEVTKKEMDISGIRTQVRSILTESLENINLATAKVIVSGGRGVGSQATFDKLSELADVLGGAVGASRGAFLEGYCDESKLVGQTNLKVAPDLYIACGISGAGQHTAGIKGAKTIIAIDRNDDADIFKVADYGLVGDINEILPEMIEVMRELRAK